MSRTDIGSGQPLSGIQWTLRVGVSTAAGGVLLGGLVAAKALHFERSRGFVANRQWFAAFAELSAVLWVWVIPGLLIGLSLGLLLGLATRGFRRSRGLPGVIPALSLTVVASSALIAAAASAVPSLRPSASGPNILLIVLDTARPDRFSLYGYQRPTSPNLEALASEATVFDEAYSTSSWTPPSHASLFTGLYPCVHGVTQEAWTKLPERFLTLAEILWEAGYRTSGIVGNPMIEMGRGFAQGFDAYYETWRLAGGEKQAHDEFLAGRGGLKGAPHVALRLLSDVLNGDDARPFFVFVNLIEPHSPYDSSREFFGRYDRHPENLLTSGQWPAYFAGLREFSEADLEHLSDLYDSEIQYVDSVVGQLVDLLRERSLLDETLLIVTSDHGEHFGEHGLVEHTFNLFETNVRIPLLIRYPPLFKGGVRDSSRVQLHDLFATVLAAARVEGVDSQGLDVSVSLQPISSRPVLMEYYYPLQSFRQIHLLQAAGAKIDSARFIGFARRLRAIRNGRLKLIIGSDDMTALYDLILDPEETDNLAERPEYATTLDSLAARLEASTAECTVRALDEVLAEQRTRERAGIEIDDETLQQLRSLGYIN